MRFLPFALTYLLVAPILSATVLVDFRQQGSTYDNKTSVDIDLYDPDADVHFVMTVSSTGGDLNSNYDHFGINDDHIDYGEVLSIVFNVDVEIEGAYFGGVGSDANDGVRAVIATEEYFFYTGEDDFNGSSNRWSPNPPVMLTAGQIVQLTTSQNVSGEKFNLKTIDVAIPHAPEPRAIILLAIGALGMLTRRQRNQAA